MDEQITIYDALADSLVGQTVAYAADHWQSDWNGDDVGFDDVLVVGLYSVPNTPISYYVDTENGYVLDAWAEEGDD